MSVSVFTKSGGKSSSKVILPKDIFYAKVTNKVNLQEVYLAEQANDRIYLARTKTRAEVRGGGRKPWKQKGTGRARAGSIRSPIWRGGGITFGPSGNENFNKKANKSAKRLALRQALSLQTQSGSVSVIDSFDSKEGKTKAAVELLTKLNLAAPILIVIGEADAMLSRAVSNISGVSLTTVQRLSGANVLNAMSILFTKDALELLKQRLEGKS